jgi:hypothetical protein
VSRGTLSGCGGEASKGQKLKTATTIIRFAAPRTGCPTDLAVPTHTPSSKASEAAVREGRTKMSISGVEDKLEAGIATYPMSSQLSCTSKDESQSFSPEVVPTSISG